ncbi:unnamed protein product [Closterium sp. Yama58-4]|nr:unnamed protein product [Closterium sp. Yama58-4]
MPHSSEAIDSPVSQSLSPSVQQWTREVGCEKSVQKRISQGLPSLNTSPLLWPCVDGRKFTDHFRQYFLRKHLGAAAFPQHIPFDGHSQPLFCQESNQQQQQQQQQWQQPEGIGGSAFGGLSYDECMTAFLAPNASFSLPEAPPYLSSLASPVLASQAPPPASQAPPPASQAATFAAPAASTSEIPFSHGAVPMHAVPMHAVPMHAVPMHAVPMHAVPVDAASSAAALHRPLKRLRDDCAGLAAHQALLRGRDSGLVLLRRGMACNTERQRQSAAEQFEQQEESSRVQQAAEEAFLEALLQEEEHRQQQQGGVASRVKRVEWPRVRSESAHPDGVLLGFSGDDPALMQHAALSAPPPTLPHEVLPTPMPPQLAAPPGFGNSTLARCIGDFAGKALDRPRVGSESALPDDVLLGCSGEVPASTQCAALSAPPPTLPLSSLPTAMLPRLAALPGSTPCVGDFAVQPGEWPCESALPDSVLLSGFSSKDLAFMQRPAPSVPPPTHPHAALPTTMPSQVPSPPDPSLRGSSSCITGAHAGSACGTQEQEHVDACVNAFGNGDYTGSNATNYDYALFLTTPLAHVLLGGSALTMPVASEPQQQALAAPGAAGTAHAATGATRGAAGAAVAEWAVEQGGTGEAGAELHGQQHCLDQEAMLAQCLELERILLLPQHQPQTATVPPTATAANAFAVSPLSTFIGPWHHHQYTEHALLNPKELANGSFHTATPSHAAAALLPWCFTISLPNQCCLRHGPTWQMLWEVMPSF